MRQWKRICSFGVASILASCLLPIEVGAVDETPASQSKNAGSFDIYWIDVEGGAATLLVTPAKESILIDTGNPGHRDPDRIFQVATKEAGLKRIDHLVTTHYHRDHFGGAATLSEAIPIGTVYDNGEFDGQRERADREYYDFKAEARKVISAGDLIDLKSDAGQPPLRLQCLAARQKFIALANTASENGDCSAHQERPVDNSDNANSVVFKLSFGAFDFLNTGDLTWNREFDLVCPSNRVGTIDVFQASHHGLDVSNNPVLIRSIAPQVAVINNGATKGCMPGMFAALKETTSIQSIYQVHKNLREDGKLINVPDEYIANHEESCRGAHIHLRVSADGKSFTVRIPSTGHEQTYACK